MNGFGFGTGGSSESGAAAEAEAAKGFGVSSQDAACVDASHPGAISATAAAGNASALAVAGPLAREGISGTVIGLPSLEPATGAICGPVARFH